MNKKRKKVIVGLLSILLSLSIIGFFSERLFHNTKNNAELAPYLIDNTLGQSTSIPCSLQSSAYDDILVDKVYVLHSGEYLLNISNLNLIKGIRYSVKFAVVTDDHSCNMEINLTDPQNRVFEIFATSGNKLTFSDYVEIPFGAALSGNYTLRFKKLDGPTLNMHIQILVDGLVHEQFDPGDTIPWMTILTIPKPNPPDAGVNYQKYLYLLPQRMYRIYIGRVMPVRGDHPSTIHVDHSLLGPPDTSVVYPIYNNELMNGLFEAKAYPFGTSLGGEYLLNFTFYPQMNYTNIVLFIADEGEIASGYEPPTRNQTELWFNLTMLMNLDAPEIGPSASIPFSAQLGLGIGLGALLVIGLAVGIYLRRKSNL